MRKYFSIVFAIILIAILFLKLYELSSTDYSQKISNSTNDTEYDQEKVSHIYGNLTKNYLISKIGEDFFNTNIEYVGVEIKSLDKGYLLPSGIETKITNSTQNIYVVIYRVKDPKNDTVTFDSYPPVFFRTYFDESGNILYASPDITADNYPLNVSIIAAKEIFRSKCGEGADSITLILNKSKFLWRFADYFCSRHCMTNWVVYLDPYTGQITSDGKCVVYTADEIEASKEAENYLISKFGKEFLDKNLEYEKIIVRTTDEQKRLWTGTQIDNNYITALNGINQIFDVTFKLKNIDSKFVLTQKNQTWVYGGIDVFLDENKSILFIIPEVNESQLA